MPISVRYLVKGSFWSVGSYAITQIVRFGTNIVLTRLLSPQLFGLFQVISALRTGVALLSDFGVQQNIIYSPNANDQDFCTTAWTMEIIRTSILWLLCVIVAVPASRFYDYPPLSYMLPIAALTLIVSGFISPGRYLLQKRLRIIELSAFEVVVSVLQGIVMVAWAYVTPSIWALIIGQLFASAVGSAASFFLRSGIHHRFRLSRRYVIEIMHFGKWVFLTSILYFLSQNYDRLYLAKLIPLDLLGVYGLARSICDIVNMVVVRLGNSVLFPFISSHSSTPRAELRAGLVRIRARFLALSCAGFSVIIVASDLLIKALYDERYQAAAWMLPTMLIGSWFAVVSGVNEAVLLGLVGPRYNVFANAVKFGVLVAALKPGFSLWGPVGIIGVVALSDFLRYVPTLIGQRIERFSFFRQDFVFTTGMACLVALLEALRWVLGLGTSFDTLTLQ